MYRTPTLALVGATLLAGCAGPPRSTIEPPPAPRADAQIDVVATRSGEQRVRVDVERLPPPERLGLDLSTYAVWIVPPGARPIAAGQLRYDRERGRGDAVVLTPYDDFRLLVTAEPGPELDDPSPVVVVDRVVRSAPRTSIR